MLRQRQRAGLELPAPTAARHGQREIIHFVGNFSPRCNACGRIPHRALSHFVSSPHAIHRRTRRLGRWFLFDFAVPAANRSPGLFRRATTPCLRVPSNSGSAPCSTAGGIACSQQPPPRHKARIPHRRSHPLDAQTAGCHPHQIAKWSGQYRRRNARYLQRRSR